MEFILIQKIINIVMVDQQTKKNILVAFAVAFAVRALNGAVELDDELVQYL